MTSDPAELPGCTFFVVAVPTPEDPDNRPDFSPVIRASTTVGLALSRGAVVVCESTVYPSATEEICDPLNVLGLMPQHRGANDGPRP